MTLPTPGAGSPVQLTWPAPGRSFLTLLAVLAVYRLGCYIPLPGLLPGLSSDMVGSQSGASERLSVFALGVVPIFSAMMLCEVAKLGFASLRRWQSASRANARALNFSVTIVALTISGLQATGIAIALEHMPVLVDDPAWLFRIQIVATLVAATALLAWLGDRVSRLGVISGFWLLFAAPSLAHAPGAVAIWIEMLREGAVSLGSLAIASAFPVLSIFLLVICGTVAGGKKPPVGTESAAFFRRPLMLDVWSPYLAYLTSGLVLGAIAYFAGDPSWTTQDSLLAYGRPPHIILIAMVIGLFTALRAGASGLGSAEHAASRHLWLPALAEIGICGTSEFLTLHLGVPFVTGGPVLIVISALALGILRSFAIQPDVPAGRSARASRNSMG